MEGLLSRNKPEDAVRGLKVFFDFDSFKVFAGKPLQSLMKGQVEGFRPLGARFIVLVYWMKS